ncbi:MAG: hypothetical protein ABW118_10440 [Candidatus Thiodiazotropha sp.]
MKVDLKLPEREELKVIEIISIGPDSPYHGIIRSTSDMNIKVISEPVLIDRIYNFMDKGKEIWKQTGEWLEQEPKIVVRFEGNMETVMMLWFDKNKISILTRPVTPKNPVITFNAGKPAVIELREMLGL